MRLLLLQRGSRDEDGKVAVLHPDLLDLRIEPILDRLPDSVRRGPKDVAAGHIVILDELALGDDL